MRLPFGLGRNTLHLVLENKEITPATLVFLRRDEELLLAMKKRSYGKDKWNGIGGKLEDNETIEAAAIRETQEEILVTPKELSKRALLSFFIRKDDGSIEPEMEVHVFATTQWEGEPQETEEMRPQWFKADALPYDNMWPDDTFWLPGMLAGKVQRGEFYFNDSFEIIDHELREVRESDIS